jgi:anti-sigma B factor antagonist
MFSVDHDRTGDVAVLQCSGRFVRGEAVFALCDAVTSECSTRIVVVDLSDVTFVDASGLGMLVYLHRWSNDHGVQMKLVNPTPFVRDVLERTRLTCIFDVSSMHDAVMILRSGELHAARAMAS